MKKILLVILMILVISACSSETQDIDFGDAASPCEYSENEIGDRVNVSGMLEFVDTTAPDGWYADLERDNCRIGIWIESIFLDEWQTSSPEVFKEGAVVVFEGTLTSYPLPDRPEEHQLIVEVDQQPVGLLDSTAEISEVGHAMPACEYQGRESGEEVSAEGEVILVDASAAAGVYLEMDEAGCYKRIWIESRFFDEWSSEQQNMIAVGNEIIVTGKLTVVRGEPTVDIKDPPSQ
jgi:hypothetical protein